MCCVRTPSKPGPCSSPVDAPASTGKPPALPANYERARDGCLSNGGDVTRELVRLRTPRSQSGATRTLDAGRPWRQPSRARALLACLRRRRGCGRPKVVASCRTQTSARSDRERAGRDAGPADAEPSSDRGSRARARRSPCVRVRDRAAATGRLRRRSRRARGADPRAARASRRRHRGRLRRQRRPRPGSSCPGSPGRTRSDRTWPPARSSARCPGRPTSQRGSSCTASGRSPPMSRAPGSSSRPCSKRSPTLPCR